MVYTVAFTKDASKTLQKILRDTANSIRSKIEQIANDPYAHHPNVKKLKNRHGYQTRVGDCRVIYEIQPDKIVVLKIGLRGEVYR
jgi:mRNA interferase RelE/StbE